MIREILKKVVSPRALEFRLVENSKKYEKKFVYERTLGETFFDDKVIYICKKRIKMDWDNVIVRKIRNLIRSNLLKDVILFVILHEYAHVAHYLTGHLDLDQEDKKKYSKKTEKMADVLALKWFKKLKKKEVI